MGGHKLTKSDVGEIRAAAGIQTMADLGRQYGVARSTIAAVINGRGWAHVERS